jgi:hypothetical protein
MIASDLHHHQQAVYSALLETAQVFFQTDWHDLSIRPRFARFIAGPTGTGKSFLVRRLAEQLDLPLLDLAASSWIPLGCSQRGARPTWTDILAFLRENLRGIIFLDEVDKLTGQSSWMQFLRVEAFYLLDGRIPDPVILQTCNTDEEPESLALNTLAKTRLADSFLVIGAGAFQDIVEARSSCISGFNTPPLKSSTELSHGDMTRTIPREIANRFAGPILNLPGLERLDYLSLLDAACRDAPTALVSKIREIGERSLDSAMTSKLGCRWIEEVMLQALVADLKTKDCSPPKRPTEKEHEDCDITTDDLPAL